jgi:uncharacterized membrane protein
MSRGMKILFTLSVLLNVFFLCACATIAFTWPRLLDEGTMHPPTPLAMAARSLDPAVHAQLRRFMRDRDAAIRPDFAAAREARARAADLAARPVFDRAAVSQELAKARGLEGQARAKVEESILDFMTTMAPDQRAKLAPGFRARPPRRPRRHAS